MIPSFSQRLGVTAASRTPRVTQLRPESSAAAASPREAVRRPPGDDEQPGGDTAQATAAPREQPSPSATAARIGTATSAR